jgi:hypothetical protein
MYRKQSLFVMMIEDSFRISMRDDDFVHLSTAGDVQRFIADALKRGGRPAADEDIWMRLRTAAREILGVENLECAMDVFPGLRGSILVA